MNQGSGWDVATGLLPGSSLSARARPRLPLGVGCAKEQLGPWAGLAGALRPEPAGNKYFWQRWASTSLLCPLCCGFSCLLPCPQPYVPKDPPVLRVTEGPFFSEVVAYYEHVRQVVRLYNLPGELGGRARSEGRSGLHQLGHTLPSACSLLTHLFSTNVLFETRRTLVFLRGRSCRNAGSSWQVGHNLPQPVSQACPRSPFVLLPRGGGAVSGHVIPGGHPRLRQPGAGPALPHGH